MKLSLLFATMVALICSSCSSVTPNPGEVGVLIKKPLIFGSGGIDPTPVQTGRAFVAPTTDAIMVTVIPQTHTEHIDDLPSKDGIKLDFDSQIQFQVTDAVELVRHFGPDWYRNNLQGQFRMFCRQAAKNYTMQELAFSQENAEKIDDQLQKQVIDYCTATKLPVKIMNITLGKAEPPAEISQQRAETAAQQQRIETEKKKAEAEESRAVAEAKRAYADRAYQSGLGITPDQYLRLEQIKAIQSSCGNPQSRCIFGNLPVLMTDK